MSTTKENKCGDGDRRGQWVLAYTRWRAVAAGRGCGRSEAWSSQQKGQGIGVPSGVTVSLEGQERGRGRRLDFIPSVRAFILFQLSAVVQCGTGMKLLLPLPSCGEWW